MSNLTKDQKSLLLYLESCAVDNSGRVSLKHMNEKEIDQARKWNDEGYIGFGRITFNDLTSGGTHWVTLSDDAWGDAHTERKAAAERLWNNRKFKATVEKR